MAEDEIKTGDIVTLKSGGPTMTVDRQAKDIRNDYTCIWFVGNEMRSGSFHKESLKK